MHQNQISISSIVSGTGVKFGTSGVRGLVSAMSDDICYAYTRAFLSAIGSDAPCVVIGHDLRPSSPAIARACAAAITDAGKEVIYAGMLPTPAIALYAQSRQAPAVVVTGSHIPFDRNGIKFYRPDGEIMKEDERAIEQATVTLPAGGISGVLPPVCSEAADHYVRRYTSFFPANALQGMHIALYAHSSAARDLIPGILGQLGATTTVLGRTDHFVPIDTEAVSEEDIQRARNWAAEHGFDAILSTDGDADRPLIGDEHGDWFRGDIVGVLCASYLGATHIATPVSSNTAAECSDLFRTVVRTKIGSPYVIDAMQAIQSQDAIVAGYEANGGFLLGTDIHRDGTTLAALPTRDALLPALALFCLAKQKDIPVSALRSLLPARFTASNRLQDFATERSKELIARLLQDPAGAATLLAPASGPHTAIDTTDGLRMTFANGDIVHLRPSGNAPELRCYAESDSQDKAQQLSLDCLQQL